MQHPGKKARGETHRVVVGAEVEGRIGIVCAPLVRTVALCRLTLIQVYLGYSTRALLASLVGCRVQVFLFRRPLLAIFTYVYVFLSRLATEDSIEHELPPSVRDELLACAYLAFTAITDLRVSYSADLFGTDASLGWGVVVRAPISPHLSAELWRRSEHGGWHTALHNRSLLAVLSRGVPLGPELTQLHRDLGLPSLEPPVAPRWVTELSESLRFRLAYKWAFRMPRHINILETTVYKSLCKHCCIRSPDTRIPILLDSKVALGATAHGRSSSPGLSHVLCSALPYVIGGGLYPGGLYVPTDVHRADDPTRNRAVRPPSREPPAWLTEAEAGDFTRFDCVAYADSRAPYPACLWGRLVSLLMAQGAWGDSLGLGATAAPSAASAEVAAGADDGSTPAGAPAPPSGSRDVSSLRVRAEEPVGGAGEASPVAPVAPAAAPDAGPQARCAPNSSFGGGASRGGSRVVPTGRAAVAPRSCQSAARLDHARRVLGVGGSA